MDCARPYALEYASLTIRAFQVLTSQGGSLGARGINYLFIFTKWLCFIIISPSPSIVIPFVIWLHWLWHTDRSPHYTPIHAKYGLAAWVCNTHAVDCVRQSPVGRDGHLGYADCGIAFQVLLLSAIHSTSSTLDNRSSGAVGGNANLTLNLFSGVT